MGHAARSYTTKPVTPDIMLLHALILAQKPKVRAAMEEKLEEIRASKVVSIGSGPSRAQVRDAADEALDFCLRLPRSAF